MTQYYKTGMGIMFSLEETNIRASEKLLETLKKDYKELDKDRYIKGLEEGLDSINYYLTRIMECINEKRKVEDTRQKIAKLEKLLEEHKSVFCDDDD